MENLKTGVNFILHGFHIIMKVPDVGLEDSLYVDAYISFWTSKEVYFNYFLSIHGFNLLSFMLTCFNN